MDTKKKIGNVGGSLGNMEDVNWKEGASNERLEEKSVGIRDTQYTERNI